MSRKESVLNKLSNNFGKLQEVGVARIGVFGSVARGDDQADSDVDIIVEFAPQMNRSKNFHALCDILDDLIGERYDLVTVGGLSPYLGPKILQETVYVENAS
ncbi:MAG: nucleotidyltransferase family protein [Opitutales bacterium]